MHFGTRRRRYVGEVRTTVAVLDIGLLSLRRAGGRMRKSAILMLLIGQLYLSNTT